MQTKSTSIYRVVIPGIPLKLRCRSQFGVSLFAQEALFALHEGLISHDEFAQIRTLFLKAQKLRALFDFGYLSAKELYAHSITLFASLANSHDTCCTTTTLYIPNDFTNQADEDNLVTKIFQEDVSKKYEMSLLGTSQQGSIDLQQQLEEVKRRHRSGLQQQQQQADKNKGNCDLEQQLEDIKSRLRRGSTFPLPKIEIQDRKGHKIKQCVDSVDEVQGSITCTSEDRVSRESFKSIYQQSSNVGEEVDGQYFRVPTINGLTRSQDGKGIRGNMSPQRERYYEESIRRREATSSPLPRIFKWGVDTDYVTLTNRHLTSSASTPRPSTPINGGWDSLVKINSEELHLVGGKTFQKQREIHHEDESQHTWRSYLRRTGLSGNLDQSDSASNPSENASLVPSVWEDYHKRQSVQDAESRFQAEHIDHSRRSGSPSPSYLKELREQTRSPTFSELSYSTQFSYVPQSRQSRGKRNDNLEYNKGGCQMSEQALDLIEQMRMQGRFRWLVFQLNSSSKVIDVSEGGGINTTAADLFAALPFDNCCYAVYNHGVCRGNNITSQRNMFINWSPEGVAVKQRMMYAQNKSILKGSLGSIALEVQVTDVEDLNLMFQRYQS